MFCYKYGEKIWICILYVEVDYKIYVEDSRF